MKGYKAFEKGMICRGKQYRENTVFEEDAAEICKRGMHFCKFPLDVLKYYPLVDEKGNISVFAEVEALGEAKTDDGEKYCTEKLKIGNEITFAELVQASIDGNMENGHYVQIGASGDGAQIGSSGDYAQIGSSGNYARIGSSGNWARIGSSGNSAQIISEGKNSVVCCAGSDSCVKAKKGSWITLSEWSNNDEGEYVPICVKTMQVDGETVKEDTFYRLKNGEFVEVDD